MSKAKSCCNCSFPGKDEMPFLSVSSLFSLQTSPVFPNRNSLSGWKKCRASWMPMEKEMSMWCVRLFEHLYRCFPTTPGTPTRSCRTMQMQKLSGMLSLGWFALCAGRDCGTYPPFFVCESSTAGQTQVGAYGREVAGCLLTGCDLGLPRSGRYGRKKGLQGETTFVGLDRAALF